MEVDFATAQLDDAPLIAKLEGAIFPGANWSADAVTSILRASGMGVVGMAAAKPACFALWSVSGEDCELYRIGVVGAWRRRGLGALLLQEIFSRSFQSGARQVFLEVDAGNEAAVKLYENAGFVVAARRTRYYRDGADALVMRLLLNAPSL